MYSILRYTGCALYYPSGLFTSRSINVSGRSWMEDIAGPRYRGYFKLLSFTTVLAMGITGLWPILQPISQRVNLTEFATNHGFLLKYNGTRAFHIGVDASVLLDGYSAASLTHGRVFHHATSDTSLSQLFQFLSQLSNAPVDCTFVYDGDDRPSLKRGRKVIKKEPLLYRKSRELIDAYGFRTHAAKGDAEAELAIMNRRGIIDAVLTKDSDIFPLGARLVLRIVPLECTDTKIIADVYDAALIEERLELTHGSLIIYALLAGNDFNKGVETFGPVSALAVARSRSRFGDLIVIDSKRMTGPQRRTHFKNIKTQLIRGLQRSTNKRIRGQTQMLIDSDFPFPEVLSWFLDAPTSWSNLVHAPDTSAWRPQGHNLGKIAKFCTDTIGWSATKTLTELEQKVWRGVIMRILCSNFLAYDATDGNLLSPLRQNALYRIGGGQPFAITNSTSIHGHNPPNLSGKVPGDTVRITFEVSDLIRLTFLPVPSSYNPKSLLNVFVPFVIIAAATGQHDLIPSLRRSDHSSTASLGDGTVSDDEVEITAFRPVHDLRIPVIDISGIDDLL